MTLAQEISPQGYLMFMFMISSCYYTVPMGPKSVLLQSLKVNYIRTCASVLFHLFKSDNLRMRKAERSSTVSQPRLSLPPGSPNCNEPAARRLSEISNVDNGRIGQINRGRNLSPIRSSVASLNQIAKKSVFRLRLHS